MPVEAFYADFAKAHFGDEVAEAVGEIFAKIDGVKLPEPSAWATGPGDIVAAKTDAKAAYRFVEELAALRPSVNEGWETSRGSTIG